jgi:hypothetical protein
MSVEAAAPDRLPWLSDEPAARPPRGRSGALAAACAAILVVGAGAFWMGARSVDELPVPSRPEASATIRLPAARPAQPGPAPQVEPIVGSPIPIVEEEPRVRHAPVRAAKAHKPHRKAGPAAKPVVIAKAEPPAPPEPWPVRDVGGASGRLVRIGAFVSPHQAKRGWWAITRVNPAIAHLPALVVPVQSLRNGRVYYRLQMGTTSQAHSAVLCQRMRMIAQSCVVIGSGAGTA